ncbi:hypothetical protein M422DRAFT_250237 [Sphaerobolus stellatus SS14]|uniref:3-carboxymuconate cyclase n=1 Tax=Sphaerobolus stellatus (strain SS14) TaxID=990650 RepID=A0A0C9UTM4_SPHS4|nr:hypothetical protein M422DRAFT_250237 [Sphaerobolus stellatus SS14]
MKFTLTSVFVALLPYISIGHAAPSQPANQVKGVAYFLTNEPTGNFIISSVIGNDGKLAVKSATYAGGVGDKVVSSPAPDDPLFSQGSVTISGNYLYVVNAGSNTVAMFAINPADPTKLTPVGKPVNSGGEFPVSVAVSEKRGLVCALNAGRLNGVSCFKLDKQRGLSPATANTQRFLGLNQTTPPQPQPGANGLSQVIFNEAETTVLASVREVGGTLRGFLAAWDIHPVTGALSASREVTAPGAIAPFSLNVLPGKNAIIATDPAFGYDIFDLSSHNRSSVFTIPGQSALCWSVYNPKTTNVFLVDSPTRLITEVTVNDKLQSTVLKQYLLPEDGDPLDADIATVNGKQFLYVLIAGPQTINVLSLPAPGSANVIQEYYFADAIAKLGVKQTENYVVGMAIYQPSW